MGGICPSPTDFWNNQCCCGAACCWDQCDWSLPPTDCLQGVPNSKWIFNSNLGYYQAFQSTAGMLLRAHKFFKTLIRISYHVHDESMSFRLRGCSRGPKIHFVGS